MREEGNGRARPGSIYIFKVPKRFEKARYSIEISQKKARLTPRARSTLYISVIQVSIVKIRGAYSQNRIGD